MKVLKNSQVIRDYYFQTSNDLRFGKDFYFQPFETKSWSILLVFITNMLQIAYMEALPDKVEIKVTADKFGLL